MIGTRLAHYEISTHLGTGGMGEVYQATDSKLGRSVAIKFLPGAFSHDNERVARFEREARVLASLNHPNIAAIFGVEESGGRKFLVMELAPGETLAARIERGAIPVDEAIRIATQIAEALESAHEAGVIHRDLKPANVKVTQDGKVKVLDFGLAKAVATDTSNGSLSNSPTISIVGTQQGVILGTAAYMSPEQAKGRVLDRRTDIFAFGCVLYEMLSGRRAFDGEDVADILGAVLKSDPDWARLPPDVPAAIQKLLRLCLQKDLRKRRQTATDVRIDIEQALSEPVVATPVAAPARGRMGWIAVLAVATVLIALLSIPAGRHLTETPLPSPPEMRVEINAPPTADPASLAISPDGQALVFAGISNGQSYLWLRPFNSVSASAHLLPGTDGASFPFWAPDSRSVAFFAHGRLREVGLDGGTPRTLAPAPAGVGGAWNRDVILFTMLGNPILRIMGRGGDATPATRLDALQGAHYSPHFLPDDRHFLYWAASGREPQGVYIGQLDASETRRLLDADFGPVYAQDHLLFVRRDVLYAQGFDWTRLDLVGTPFKVAEQVASSQSTVRAAVSTSANGTIVYRTGSSTGKRQLTWFDQSGTPGKSVGSAFSSTQLNPSVSPDGRRVALFRSVDNNIDIWLIDVDHDAPTQFTVDSADDVRPLWSPHDQGKSIVFSSNREGFHNLYRKPISAAAGGEELIHRTEQNKSATDWSRDGRFLLFDSVDSKRNIDIWALPLDGDKTPFPVVQTDEEEHGGQFSPDGKWIAYVAITAGRYEVYVRPFMRDGQGKRISSAGGDQVRWGPDGKELFYIAPDGQLVKVLIRIDSTSDTVEPGTPDRLFATLVGDAMGGTRGVQYTVSQDPQGRLRFLMNTLSAEVNTSPITVILNWKPKP